MSTALSSVTASATGFEHFMTLSSSLVSPFPLVPMCNSGSPDDLVLMRQLSAFGCQQATKRGLNHSQLLRSPTGTEGSELVALRWSDVERPGSAVARGG